MVAKRGQILVLCSTVLHSAWQNEDTATRKALCVTSHGRYTVAQPILLYKVGSRYVTSFFCTRAVQMGRGFPKESAPGCQKSS